MRKNGRPRNDRLRAMRFALWALQAPSEELTGPNIQALLDCCEETALGYRRDFIEARGPLEIMGIPPPRLTDHTLPPAATGQATSTHRS